MLRVLFLGQELSVLDALLGSDVDVVGAYLQSSRSRLPRWLRPAAGVLPRRVRRAVKRDQVRDALAAGLAQRGVPMLGAPGVNDPGLAVRLEELGVELGVVATFAEILREPLLEIPRLGFINLHPSLLPRYRGPQPLGHILLNEERRSGATWHRVTPKVDGGAILAQTSFEVAARETRRSLHDRAAAAGAALLPPLLRSLEEGRVSARPQDEEQASYFPKLTRDQKRRLRQMGKLGRLA